MSRGDSFNHTTVKVGLIQSLSGLMADSEAGLVEAARMAIDEINRSGGVLGSRIEPIIEDGGSWPEAFGHKAEALFKAGAQTLFGCWSSASRRVVKREAEIFDGMLWYPAQYEGLEESPHIVYTGGCLNQQITPAVEWLFTEVGSRIYLGGSDSAFPHTANPFIRSIVDLHGGTGKIVGERYVQPGGENFEAILEDIKQQNPHVIFSTLEGGSNLAFFLQYHAAGLDPRKIPILSVRAGERELQAIGPDATGHLVCTNYFQNLDRSENQEFIGKFQQRYGPELTASAGAVTAYCQIYLWKQTVEAARSFQPAEIRKHLKGQEFRGPMGPMVIQGNQHCSLPAYIGRFMPTGDFGIVWRSPGPIAPLPWMGVENTQLPCKHLVKEAMVSSFGVDIAEKRHAEETVRRHAAFGDLITGLLTQFASCTEDKIDGAIESCLHKVASFIGADYAFVISLPADLASWSLTHEWCGHGIEGRKANFHAKPMGLLPWCDAELKMGRIVRIDPSAPLPPELVAEHDNSYWQGMQALLQIPLRGRDGTTRGCVGLASSSRESNWSDEEVQELAMAAEAIAAALERQHAEERMQEQGALLDIAQDSISVLDLEGKVQYWNQGAERLTGWKAEEVVGRKVKPEFYFECRDKLVEARQQIMQSGNWQGELVLHVKDRKRVQVRSSRTLVRDKNGRPKAILVVDSDVTEQKKIESRLLRSQRVESLGRLANGVAHDLNNVLTPILMAADMLHKKVTDPKGIEMLEMLTISTMRGADIIKQLLIYSRGEEGKEVNLKVNDLIKETARLVQETFPKSISVQVKLTEDLKPVQGDPTQTHQVLLNLCVNARDAMHGGGILTLSAQNVEVDAVLVREYPDARLGSYVVMEVSDTGAGIPPEIIDRIFEPFFTTKGIGQGTGLGLSTVMGIVKSRGGFIQIKSTVGRGTQFRIYLPAAKAEIATETEKHFTTIAPASGELILIAEDEIVLREIAKEFLEEKGYHVLTANDGLDALALYKQHRAEIRAVLVDMWMPRMDGNATIKELLALTPDLVIIAMSGLPTLKAEMEKNGVKVSAFLPKPWTPIQLLTTLGECLGNAGKKGSNEAVF